MFLPLLDSVLVKKKKKKMVGEPGLLDARKAELLYHLDQTVSASSQSLRFILSLRLYSSFNPDASVSQTVQIHIAINQRTTWS